MKKIFTLSLIFLILVSCVCFVSCNNLDEDITTEQTEEQTEQTQDQTQEQRTFTNPGDNLGGGKNGTLPTEVVTIDASTYQSAVDLSELSTDVSADDATEVNGSSTLYSITAAGNYTLSGNFPMGIEIAVGNNETTHIFLNNATISNGAGVAISNTNKKSSLIITALEGTTNTVTNIGDDVNAINVKGTLSINGSGTINITSTSKNGIKVSKGLSIVDVNLTVNSNNHAIAARFISAENATITVTAAAKDGLNAECDDETTTFPEDYSEGYVSLKNVTYTANVNGDGIQADTMVFIDGGSIDITTNGKFIAYSAENMETYDLVEDDFRYIKSGTTYKKVASDYNGRTNTMYALAQSCKGIKVGEIKYEDEESGEEISVTEGAYMLVIDGNVTVKINSTDDAIHTNCGSTLIKNGTYTINTYDDAITSDIMTQIEGGTITIESCYEGLEGAYVKINGGTLNITSSDDAINAASDDTAIVEYIIINGGDITIDASGDGIDSNGSFLMTAGKLTVFGPTTGADAALDSETGIIINGGTVFASSTLGMVETPSTNSASYVLCYAQSTSLTVGTVFTIKNSNAEEIFSVTIQKACQTIIVCLPAFEKDATYTISTDGADVTTFTITDTITSVGAIGGMGGNGGGMGGNGGEMGGTPGEMGGNPGEMGGGSQPTPPTGDGQNPPAKPTGDFQPGTTTNS